MKKILLISAISVYLTTPILAQNWTFQEILLDLEDTLNAPMAGNYTSGYPLNGMHGVVVAPDGNVWIAIHNGYGNEFIGYNHSAGVADTVCHYKPVWVINPVTKDHISFSPINQLSFPDGSIDTLYAESIQNGSGKGIALDNDGNILYSSWSTLYRINYQTGEGMNKFTPWYDMGSATEATQDDAGNIYYGYVVGTSRPVYILDNDFNLLGNAIDALGHFTRSLEISDDGKDLYVGSTWYGFGVEHWHDNSVIPGVTDFQVADTFAVFSDVPAKWAYVSSAVGEWAYIACDFSEADTIFPHVPLWSSSLDFDATGNLWVGALTAIWGGPLGGKFYAFNPATYECINTAGIQHGDRLLGGTDGPRGAAWTPNGRTMYLADFYSNAIGVWTTDSVFPPNGDIAITVGTVTVFSGDTATIPISVEFPADSSYSSLEISFAGFQGLVDFIGIDTTNSLIGAAGWTYALNETDSILITAWAGSDNISGQGMLFGLTFAVPDTTTEDISITVVDVLFDENGESIGVIPGGIEIFHIFPGDVSLDGEVHAYDASLILKFIVGLEPLNAFQKANANVSSDTSVSALDASFILQYVVSLIDTLPQDNTAFSATGDIAMNDYEIQAGEPIAIPLYLSNGDNIFSFESEIQFNSAHLTLSEVLWAQAVNHFSIETNTEDGTLLLAGAGTSEDGHQGAFATLIFNVAPDFDANETYVTLHRHRWNEEPVQTDAAVSTLTRVLGIGEFSGIPTAFQLRQNYPNPFNPVTTIRYDLPKQTQVMITIYDMLGREVVTLLNRFEDPGYRFVSWDGTGRQGRPASAGVYMYQIRAGEFSQTRKMVLLK